MWGYFYWEWQNQASDPSSSTDLFVVDELMSAKEHPTMVGAVAVTAGLIFLRGMCETIGTKGSIFLIKCVWKRYMSMYLYKRKIVNKEAK